VSPDGLNTYVVSGDGAVSTFIRNRGSGALSFARCVKDRTSTEVCQTNVSASVEDNLSGARSVKVSPDGRNVYVAASAGTAPFNSDAITAFSRDTGTGLLTPLAGKELCISETLGGREDDPGSCRQGFGLSGVARIDVSPDGSRVYAVSPTDSTLAVLTRDPATGGLTQATANCFRGSQSPDTDCTGNGNGAVPGLNGVNAVAVAPDSVGVYATSQARDTLVALRAAETNGGLQFAECERGTTSESTDCTSVPAQGLNSPNAVEVAPNGADVYTASSQGSAPGTGNTLTEFNRDANSTVSMARCVRDPSSTAEAPPPNGTGACSVVSRGLRNSSFIAIRPNGSSLYVAATGGSDIAQFSRDTGSGAVTPLPGRDQCISDGSADCADNNTARGLGGITEVAAGPDDLFVYSAAPGDDAVAAFSVAVPPQCQDVSQPTSPTNQPVTIPLRCSDPNGDAFTLSIVSQPANGSVTVNQDDDTATFRPNTGFSGQTTFTYKATDSRGQESNTATVTVNVASAGAPAITISDATVDEGSSGTTTLTFNLNLSLAIGSPTTVDFSTENDTATAPSDFTATSGQATFGANQTTTTVTVPVVGDRVREATERLRVNISNPTNGAVIADSQALGGIANDDQSVINVGDVTVGEAGGNAVFQITLSNPSDSTVQATYSTQGQTATATSDYVAQAGLRVSFAPGETSKTVPVRLVDDANTERTETFRLVLSDATGGATLGNSTGVATIIDNDPPEITVSNAAVAEGSSGTRATTFTIALSAPVSNEVRANFATVDDSARQPGDYTQRSGTVVFAAGETSKTVDVDVKGDTEVESDETFRLRLSNLGGARAGRLDGIATIVNDDEAPARDTTPPPPPPPPIPTLSVSDTAAPEGDAGTRQAPFTVSLSAARNVPVSVRFATANGSAQSGTDYTAATGTLTFAPGETSKTVPIAIRGDRRVEPNEDLRLNLSNPVAASLAKAVGVARIANDDKARLAPRSISVRVSPGRDRAKPFRFRTTGRVNLPAGVTRTAGCVGRVSIQIKRGSNTISTRRRTLTKSCTFSSTVKFDDRSRLPRTGRLKVTVRFLGNPALLPRGARSRFVRFGR